MNITTALKIPIETCLVFIRIWTSNFRHGKIDLSNDKVWRHWSLTFPSNWRRRKQPQPSTGSDRHRWRSDRKLCRELRRLGWLRRPTNESTRANRTLYTWELPSKWWRLACLLRTCLSRLTLLWGIPWRHSDLTNIKSVFFNFSCWCK